MLRACGITLANDQAYLLEQRLGPLVAGTGFDSTADLVCAVCDGAGGSDLAMKVLDALATHETFFFRDLPFWRAFEEVIMPRLLAGGRQRLRFASLACAHGQEPYSIAMLLEEKWPEIARASVIHASDVSAPAVERARDGTYSVFEVNRGLGAARLLRHFDRSPKGGFAIKPALRGRVTFWTENLLEHRVPVEPFDVVLCRNVLIYFGDAERAAALRRLGSSLRAGGFLGLGVSEVGRGTPVAPGWFVTNAAEAVLR